TAPSTRTTRRSASTSTERGRPAVETCTPVVSATRLNECREPSARGDSRAGSSSCSSATEAGSTRRVAASVRLPPQLVLIDLSSLVVRPAPPADGTGPGPSPHQEGPGPFRRVLRLVAQRVLKAASNAAPGAGKA